MELPYHKGVNPLLDEFIAKLKADGFRWSLVMIILNIRVFIVSQGEPFTHVHQLNEEFFSRQGENLAKFIKDSKEFQIKLSRGEYEHTVL